VFTPGSGPNRWTVTLDEDGTYRTTLYGGDSGHFCAHFKRSRTGTIGLWRVDCRPFNQATNRLDADLKILGLIRVQVQPFGGERAREHRSLQVFVTSLKRGSVSQSGSFTATDGFSGEYFLRDYDTFDVSVQSRAAGQPELVRSRVTLSPENSEAHVFLVVP
jgi:hypothetical protein